ncbi:GNAT family N-acetyltransferase [Roseburia sp. 499]|uniref:GNAT family N-acetyltransferase n=1 Tax=Roseburia sp. 499 TaxID=1261634 RepID=UPI000952DD7D|nr:GNAT family N-acetyltransferase [Roseburia sp. 499]WVK71321.1 GNAT family N-acetyltransferase [Roseburia sp. 499]
MLINDEIINVKGKELLFRNATEEDAQMLIDYLKVTCGETRYLVKEPEEIKFTLEQEKKFITQINNSENNLMLLGFLDGKYVGNCSLMGMATSRYKHRASMGIALYQKYTGMGIGRAMIEKLFAVANEKGFEQIELEVVADNERAIHLYKNMGFEIYGTFPNNMKYKDGTYADAYWMMKKL